MTGIDNKPGMLGRYLGIATGQPFQAGLVNQRTGIIAWRPLECTACAVHFEWLFAAPPFHEIIHSRLDFRLISQLQLQLYFNDKLLKTLKNAFPVSKFKISRFIRVHAAIAVYRAYTGNDMAHFTAIRTGIHEYGPAQSSRYATGKFHTCQAVLLGKLADILQHEP